MKKNLFLSICIPLYNGEQFICEALDSIQKQDCIEQLEVVVVDDLSSDNGYEVVQRYQQSHSLNIRLYKNERNMGGGFTRNAACAKTQGDYVLFLDHDDALFDHALDKILSGFRNRDCDMIIGGYAGADDKLHPRCQFMNPAEQTTGLSVALKLSHYQFEIRSGSYLVKRSIIEENQILERSGNLFGCDQKINYLCLLHSKTVEVTQIPLYIYRTAPHSEMTSTPTLKRYEQCQVRKELLADIRRNFPLEKELADRFERVLIPESVVAITRVFYYTGFDKKVLSQYLKSTGYEAIQRQTVRNDTISTAFRIEAFLQLYAKPLYRLICLLKRKVIK